MNTVNIPSKSISKLDLSNSGLTDFPKEVFGLRNLRKLNLSNNKIKTVPKEIQKLRLLETLDLSNNKIGGFYANLCRLKNLKRLNLNNNNLKSIPKQVEYLQKLTTLMIANNNIIKPPNEIIGLGSLEKLNLSGNDFDEFPSGVLGLEQLKFLWLNKLRIKHFPIDVILEKNKSLKGVYCYGPIINDASVDKNYLDLSKVKGNCLKNLKILTAKIKQPRVSIATNDQTKSSNKTESKEKVMIDKKHIFISYSHQDKEWLKKVTTNLKVLQIHNLSDKFEVWDDTKIKSGDRWKVEIKDALAKSGIAILIVSTDFLASDFIKSEELPDILKNAQEQGTKILPLIIRPCLFTSIPSLSVFQAINDPNVPLTSCSQTEQEEILVELAKTVNDILES